MSTSAAGHLSPAFPERAAWGTASKLRAWQEEALAVAQHKPNVYIDLSGWSPKYFPKILVQYANTMLKKKMLFGSDWPMISPEKWLDAFDKADFRPEVRPLILKENAMRLLGVAD